MTNQQISWELTAIDRASAVFKNVESGMSGMSAAWSRFQGLAVTTVVGEGMMKVAEATKEAEQASNRLGAVLRNTGATAGFTRGQLDGMADALAKSTQFDDKDIKKAEAEILIFGKIHGQTFKDALKLSTDVAAFWGTDLPSAARDVAKALSEPETAFKLLKSAGVTLTDQQKDQIKHMGALGDLAGQQVVIMNLLTKAYHGTAEEMNTGYTKAMGEAHKAWDEMLIALGKTAAVRVPVQTFFGFLEQSLKDIKQIVENGDWVEKLLGIAAFAGGQRGLTLTPQSDGAGGSRSASGMIGGLPSESPGLSDADYAAQKLARSTAAGMAQVGLSEQQVWISEAQKTLDLMHQNGLESEEKYYEERRALIARKLKAELSAIGAAEAAQRAILATNTTGPEGAAAQLALAKLGVQRKAAFSNAGAESDALTFQQKAAKNALNQEMLKSETTYMSAMDAELQKQLDLRYAARTADKDYQSDMQFELDLIGKTAIEQQKMNEIRKIDLKLRADIRAAADAGDGGNMDLFNRTVADLTKAAEAQKTAVLSSVDARIAAERSWATGAKSAFDDYIDSAGNAATQAKTLMEDSFRSMEDALVNFVKTGKLDFKSLADSIISDLIRIEVRKDMAKAAAAMESSGGLLGGLGKLLGLGSGVATNVATSSGSVSAAEAFASGYTPMAAGGDFLVTKPTLFLAGEAGTERATFSGANNVRMQTPAQQSSSGPGIVFNNDFRGADAGAMSAINSKLAQFKRDVVPQVVDAVRRGGAARSYMRG